MVMGSTFACVCLPDPKQMCLVVRFPRHTANFVCLSTVRADKRSLSRDDRARPGGQPGAGQEMVSGGWRAVESSLPRQSWGDLWCRRQGT